ncbi:MAG: hypothetical protein IT556_06915 [Acetobacteraceae bacterium]|nr:hypothetical protein [Acetobacteraceae bacterium]
MIRILKIIAREIQGLLVDDERLALGLLAWTAVVGAALALRPAASDLVAGLCLAIGLVAVLLVTVLRRAGRPGG